MIRRGSLILFKNDTGIFARLIRFFTQSEYHHVGLVIGTQKHRQGLVLHIIEAKVLKGVILTKYVYNNSDHSIYEHMSMTLKLRHKICSEAFLYLGSKYDWVAVIYKLFLKITFGDRRKNILNDKDSYYCSEFVSQLFAENGLYFSRRIPIENIEPVNIALSKYTTEVLA
ncbi:MAG: hypothetical protein GY817_01230 [bacterium]|nr:hypothetical protein [bacterium]